MSPKSPASREDRAQSLSREDRAQSLSREDRAQNLSREDRARNLSRVVRARVVTREARPGTSLGVTFAGVIILGAIALVDRFGIPLPWELLPPSTGACVAVAAFVACAVGPWLTRGRPRSVTAQLADGSVRADGVAILAPEVTGAQVADGARGVSVAIAARGEVVFLEVDDRAAAAAVLAALGIHQVPHGRIAIGDRLGRVLGALQWLLSLGTAAMAFVFSLSFLVDGSGGAAGIGALGFALAGLPVLFARVSLAGGPLAFGDGAYREHVALHSAAVPSEPAPVEFEPASLGILGRGDESVRTWLARLDAQSADAHVYRGAAAKREELWATLEDEGAPIDARMGAARVLARRHGERPPELVRVVADPDVRVRVEAALETEEDAERKLEELGPLFRARARSDDRR